MEIKTTHPYTYHCVHVPVLVTRIWGCSEISIRTSDPTITSNSTHLNYFPSLLWNSGYITPQSYNLQSTEFRDLPPGARDKSRAESLPNLRHREKAQGLCGCHLKYPWDSDFILESIAEA